MPFSDKQVFLDRWRAHHAPFVERAAVEFEEDQRRAAKYLAAGDFQRGVGAALDCVASGGRVLGYQVAATGAPPDLTLASKILTYGGWGWSALHAHFENEGMPRYGPTGHEDALVWLYCLARTCGRDSLADWLATYIYNCFVTGTIDGAPGDVTFNNFTWMLFRAIDKKAWPTVDEVPPDVGLYRGLLVADDPAAFDAAATAICTWVASARLDGIPGPDGEPSIYEYDPWGLFPLDILATAVERQRITNDGHWVPTGHPLLEPPFTSLLPIRTELRDDLTAQMAKAAALRFGHQWQPWPTLA